MFRDRDFIFDTYLRRICAQHDFLDNYAQRVKPTLFESSRPPFFGVFVYLATDDSAALSQLYPQPEVNFYQQGVPQAPIDLHY